MKKTDEQIAVRVARNSIIINIFLSAIKLVAGILSGSAAMISDAIHSIADLTSTIVAVVGVKVAAREPDANHPYGHERFECVAAVIVATLICVTGVGIGWTGIRKDNQW